MNLLLAVQIATITTMIFVTSLAPSQADEAGNIDIAELIGADKVAASKILGKPKKCEVYKFKPNREKCYYSNENDIVFFNGIADWIFVWPQPKSYERPHMQMLSMLMLSTNARPAFSNPIAVTRWSNAEFTSTKSGKKFRALEVGAYSSGYVLIYVKTQA